MAVLTGMRGYFAVHRICIFLVMSEAESPLMCLLATCEPLYRNVCWGLSRFFHVRWLGVLLYSYRHTLCILDTNPLPNTQFTNSVPFPRLIFTVSPFTVNHLGWYNLTWFFNYLWFDVVCVYVWNNWHLVNVVPIFTMFSSTTFTVSGFYLKYLFYIFVIFAIVISSLRIWYDVFWSCLPFYMVK